MSVREQSTAPAVVAVDIGGTKTAAALVDASGQISHRIQRPTPAAQGAAAILDALEQRTIHTQQAIDQLSQLIEERELADAERDRLGLDPTSFAVYWHLKSDGATDALPMAQEIVASAQKYPNHAQNDDEQRKLKSEIYRALVTRGVDGARMVKLGDSILRLLRR